LKTSFANRRVFQHERNALLFRYDDDSLRECLARVCDDVEGTFEIACAGFALRDDPRLRFGGFEKIIELTACPVPQS